MAIVLKDGQTFTDKNGEVRSSAYGIISRPTITRVDGFADIIIDIFPTEAIRDLGDVNKRIGEIKRQFHGQDYIDNIKDKDTAGLYAAMMAEEVDTAVWESDE